MIDLDAALDTLGSRQPRPNAFQRPSAASSLPPFDHATGETSSEADTDTDTGSAMDTIPDGVSETVWEAIEKADEAFLPWVPQSGRKIVRVLDRKVVQNLDAVELLTRSGLFGAPFGFDVAPNLLLLDSETCYDFKKRNSVSLFLSVQSAESLRHDLIEVDKTRLELIKLGEWWSSLPCRSQALQHYPGFSSENKKMQLEVEVVSLNWTCFGTSFNGVAARISHGRTPEGKHFSRQFIACSYGDIDQRNEGSQELRRAGPYPLGSRTNPLQSVNPFALVLNGLLQYRSFRLAGGDPLQLSPTNQEILKKNQELAELVLNDPALKAWEGQGKPTPQLRAPLVSTSRGQDLKSDGGWRRRGIRRWASEVAASSGGESIDLDSETHEQPSTRAAKRKRGQEWKEQ